ncbi:T9SS type B sorting domain-containing protein [Mesonia sp.]|uniref:T9SS type B sorting domain-containing protein n=1 Tax=Mesonia sp. TaxID=1960830 RepID=UPI0025C10EAB|nr:T9SS type B sorting domain-containing protein [Mesonia sp.]
MKKLLPYLILLLTTLSYSQTVTLPQTNNTPEDLVNILLNNACVEVSNVALSSQESVAYFTNNGGDFPIEEGVVIRTGNAQFVEGSYTGENLSSQLNSNSDNDLESINEASGQSSELTDTAFLEFEFVPLSSNFNFNFLFASNEYGEWQCISSDVFAFLLTNLDTGETQNLAIIPGTDTPVSVKNIKDSQYNNSCESDHANLFDVYNVNNSSNSSVNMRGYTKTLQASANISPGTTYKIRLVIADSNDANFDSAIFLDAGSFSADVNLGEDQTICEGDSNTITTGLDENEYSHSWTYNGQVVPGLTTNSIQATQTGVYGVLITKEGTNCLISDQIEFTELTFQSPEDIIECYAGSDSYTYDLTYNNAENLGIENGNYVLHYFESEADLAVLNPIPSSEIESFLSEGNQTIYVKLFNNVTGNYCSSLGSFDLLVNDPMQVDTPEPIQICTMPDSNTILSLPMANSLLIADEASNYNFSYYTSEENANSATDAIENFSNYEVSIDVDSVVIWVRVEELGNNNCFQVVPVAFEMNEPPQVSELEDVVECEVFVLPEIEHGQYYSSPNGQGEQLPVGYEVVESGTVYIFNGPDENGCFNQSSFKVAIIMDYSIQLEHCGYYKIPYPPAGEFYTAQGGPEGQGDLLVSGSYIYESQTIWFYAEVDGVFCREEAFDVTILPLPPVDEPENVITCESYTLPTLENGNYFTEAGGNGLMLSGGEEITQSNTYYVFNDDGVCDNQHEFTITILPEFEDLVVCGGYELPQVNVGGFYTEPQGQGDSIEGGTYIEESQTIYYYAETTSLPNCTDNTSFYIEVKPIPPVDSLQDITLCEDETYTLPSVINGEFFTGSGRTGTMLSAGDMITSTQTIYINNEENGCDNETSFEVEIRSFPLVSNFTDVYDCDAYELPEIEHGVYYTDSLAQGDQLFPGDIITSTQTIFIYNEYEDLQGCYNEDSFTVYIEGVNIALVEDVYVCESYTLPSLEVGDYYTESGGEGNHLNPGYVVSEDREIFIYAKNGTRFVCETEVSFNIQVEQPDLSEFEDVESCGSFTLPNISNSNFNVNYYWQSGGQGQIQESDYVFDNPGVYSVYVYAYSNNDENCFKEKEIEITVYERPQLYIEGGAICRDVETGEVESSYYLISGLDASEFKVYWYLNNENVHIGPEYEAVEAGEYYVEVEKINPEIGADCNYLPTTVTVLESGRPEIKVNVTEPFEDIANINVEVVNGYGEYLYSLDGSPFQESNIFQNVASGPHEVSVKGEYGDCGSTVLEVDVIKYPRFFTPNQDGINDTWNIFDLRFDSNAQVTIYDRFGKLLTTISPAGKGWEGIYHNKNMPSNDYWFLVDYVYEGEKRQFKSHFTLKR